MRDKAEQQINEQFIKDSINNQITRQVIVDHYEQIIKDEKDKFKKTHESIALRLVSNNIEENLGIQNSKGKIKVTAKKNKPKKVTEETDEQEDPD